MPRQKEHLQVIKLISVEHLSVPYFYPILFPYDRDFTDLIEPLRGGFRDEDAIIVREKKHKKGFFEIISGVRRWQAAVEINLKKIKCLVKQMDDSEAIIYAAGSNLQVRNGSYPLTIIQALALKQAIEEQGGECRRPIIMQVTNCQPATYRKAVCSLNFSIQKLKKEFFADEVELKKSELIARAIAENLWQPFTDFYFGNIKVDAFKKKFYDQSEYARENKIFSPKKIRQAGKTEAEKLIESYVQIIERLHVLWEKSNKKQNDEIDWERLINQKFNSKSSISMLELIVNYLPGTGTFKPGGEQQ